MLWTILLPNNHQLLLSSVGEKYSCARLPTFSTNRNHARHPATTHDPMSRMTTELPQPAPRLPLRCHCHLLRDKRQGAAGMSMTVCARRPSRETCAPAARLACTDVGYTSTSTISTAPLLGYDVCAACVDTTIGGYDVCGVCVDVTIGDTTFAARLITAFTNK
jgi:hypothetical protein